MAPDESRTQQLLVQIYKEIEATEAYHAMMLSKFDAETRRAYEKGGIACAQHLKRALGCVAIEFGLKYPPPARNLTLVKKNNE